MAAPNPSRLDANQVLQGSFDESTGRLRTDAEATIVNADIDVSLEASEDNVAIATPDGNFLEIDPDGSANTRITNGSGASAVNIQDGGNSITVDNSALSSLDTKVNVTISTRASETTLSSLNSKITNNYGVSTGAARTAAQIGNTTGEADFNAGVTGAQTLRTTSNITRNGTELSYNIGIPDSNTLRTAATQIGIDANSVVVAGWMSGIDDSNSTATPLGAGATFTGTWKDLSQYVNISLMIKSDVPSAVGGLQIQFSTDGTSVTRNLTGTYVVTSNGLYLTLPVEAKYYRIVYLNGDSPQTTFEFQSMLDTRQTGSATVPINFPLVDMNSVIINRSIITGKSTDGQYVNQRADGISTGNSSSTPLGPGEIFTGVWEDVLGYANITQTIYTDQNSATDGLLIEYSSDGVNIDTFDTYTMSGGNGHQLSSGATTRYFRVRYINGPIAQTEFRLQTVYHITAPKPSTHRIADTINGQNDAELVKSVTTGLNPNDSFINIRAQGPHSGNSSTTPLAANATFRGTWFNWQANYLKLITALKSDTSGTLFIDFSEAVNPANGVDTDVTDFVTIPYNASAAVSLLKRHTPVQSLWVRHRYTNGITAQSTFLLDAAFVVNDPGLTLTPASIVPTVNAMAGIVRNLPAVLNAAGTAYQEVPVNSTTGKPEVDINKFHDDLLLKSHTSASATQLSIGTTATRVDTSPLSNRRNVIIANDGSSNVAIGFSNAITYTTQSFKLAAGASRELRIGESVPIWAITENTGGIQTVLTRSGSTNSGTATNTANALVSDNIYANITAAAQTVNIGGFTAGTANPLVSVRLGMESNKQSGQFETVTYQDVVTGNAAATGSVSTSATVTAATNHLYIAAIGRESSISVTTVSGLGLTWTQVIQQNSPDNNRAVGIWYAIGTPTGNSVVTASFSAVAALSHISVSRFSNVNPTTPIQAFLGSSANDSAPSTGGLSATNKGMVVFATEYDNATTFTPGAGYTTISAEFGNEGLGVMRKAVVATGTETPTSTINANKNWAGIAVTLNPAVATDPRVTLSYTLSSVPGATSGIVTLTSSTDSTSYVNVTSDRMWVVADIPNVNVIATGTTIGSAAANVDYLFLELTDTTGNTTRVSLIETGETVT